MKSMIPKYVFDASAQTVTFTEFEELSLERVLLIVNCTDGEVLFSFVEPLKGGSVSGNVLTLDYDTSGMSDSDDLAVYYDTRPFDPQYDRQIVGNARSKFRDGFSSLDPTGLPKPEVWDYTTAAGHIINYGGNSQSSSYLRISLDPFTDSNEVTLTSKETFTMPMRVGFGVSLSQRIVGQEVFIGLVESGDNGVGIDTMDPEADKALTSSIVVSGNVGTVTLANHGFSGGDRVAIYGCAEHRLNVGPVTVTVLDKNTFTVPITLTSATYPTTGGFVRHADPLRGAKNGFGLLFENATTTNASLVSRRNGEKYRSANQTIASSTALQSNTSGHTDAFNSGSINELFLAMDECSYRSFGADSNTTMSGANKYSQGIPDEDKEYKIHIRARNLSGMTKPIARVISIAKSGTTTATVTTDVSHGLAVGDYVQVYGVRDQTNFPNLSAQTVVASVPAANQFTVVQGTAVTANSDGGAVFKNEGSVLAPGMVSMAVQAIARTDGVMNINGSASWTGLLPGEYIQVYGMTGGAAAYNGAYKILRANASVLEVDAPGPDFSNITTGGAVFKRTDVRLHFARLLDYTRHYVEIMGGRGTTTDANNAVPVSIAAATGYAVFGNAQATASATGATTRHRLIAAATTNATVVKSTAGRLFDFHVFNASATVKYMKFYNKATAPTVGTDTPVETYPLAPGVMTRINFGDRGNYFSTGIGYALTGALADNDTTALAASDVIVNLQFL